MLSANSNPESTHSIGNVDIHKIMNSTGQVVTCILLKAGETIEMREVQIDTTPKAVQAQKILGGPITFLGQYESEGTVVIVLRNQSSNNLHENKHRLQPPLHKENVRGDILIMKVKGDEGENESFFEDYKQSDYEKFLGMEIEEFEVKVDATRVKEGLLLVPGADNDEEESSEDEESVEGESDSEDEADMTAFLLSQMIEKFKSVNGREPSEEELGHIANVIKEKFGVMIPEDCEEDEEE